MAIPIPSIMRKAAGSRSPLALWLLCPQWGILHSVGFSHKAIAGILLAAVTVAAIYVCSTSP